MIRAVIPKINLMLALFDPYAFPIFQSGIQNIRPNDSCKVQCGFIAKFKGSELNNFNLAAKRNQLFVNKAKKYKGILFAKFQGHGAGIEGIDQKIRWDASIDFT